MTGVVDVVLVQNRSFTCTEHIPVKDYILEPDDYVAVLQLSPEFEQIPVPAGPKGRKDKLRYRRELFAWNWREERIREGASVDAETVSLAKEISKRMDVVLIQSGADIEFGEEHNPYLVSKEPSMTYDITAQVVKGRPTVETYLRDAGIALDDGAVIFSSLRRRQNEVWMSNLEMVCDAIPGDYESARTRYLLEGGQTLSGEKLYFIGSKDALEFLKGEGLNVEGLSRGIQHPDFFGMLLPDVAFIGDVAMEKEANYDGHRFVRCLTKPLRKHLPKDFGDVRSLPVLITYGFYDDIRFFPYPNCVTLGDEVFMPVTGLERYSEFDNQAVGSVEDAGYDVVPVDFFAHNHAGFGGIRCNTFFLPKL